MLFNPLLSIRGNRKSKSYDYDFEPDPPELLNLDLVVRLYNHDPMCMSLTTREAMQTKTKVPITMNLGNQSGYGHEMPFCCAYLDASNPNFESIKYTVEQTGLGHPYLRNGEPVTCESGTYVYPLYEFDEDKLRAMDPEGMAMYVGRYGVGVYQHRVQGAIRAAIFQENSRRLEAGLPIHEEREPDDFEY